MASPDEEVRGLFHKVEIPADVLMSTVSRFGFGTVSTGLKPDPPFEDGHNICYDEQGNRFDFMLDMEKGEAYPLQFKGDYGTAKDFLSTLAPSVKGGTALWNYIDYDYDDAPWVTDFSDGHMFESKPDMGKTVDALLLASKGAMTAVEPPEARHIPLNDMELPLEQIGFDDEISEVGALLNFYIPSTFDVDAVFGTNVESLDNDDWLNVYANYDMALGEVTDRLELSLNRADGGIEYMTYPLSAEQRDALRQKMDAYCEAQTGKSLDALAQEIMGGKQPGTDAHVKDGDLYVGEWRVHLIHEGERYGATNSLVYGDEIQSWDGKHVNDCQEHGHGLPLVEFYHISENFPEEGRFVSRYFMSTLLGMDGKVFDKSIGEMKAFGLEGSVPDWTLRGDDLKEVYRFLCEARDAQETADPIRKENTVPDHNKRMRLGDAARESRTSSQALAGDGNHDDRVQDAR